MEMYICISLDFANSPVTSQNNRDTHSCEDVMWPILDKQQISLNTSLLRYEIERALQVVHV